jgi:hypothetical protein
MLGKVDELAVNADTFYTFQSRRNNQGCWWPLMVSMNVEN